jgi:hypothetical protein
MKKQTLPRLTIIKTEIFHHHDDRLCFAGVSSSTENGEARSWSENPRKCHRLRPVCS